MNIHSIDLDAAIARLIEAKNQTVDGGLSGAYLADDRNMLSFLDAEAEVVENLGRSAGIGKFDVAEVDFTPDALTANKSRVIGPLDWLGHHLVQRR